MRNRLKCVLDWAKPWLHLQQGRRGFSAHIKSHTLWYFDVQGKQSDTVDNIANINIARIRNAQNFAVTKPRRPLSSQWQTSWCHDTIQLHWGYTCTLGHQKVNTRLCGHHSLTQRLSLCHSRTKAGPARERAGRHRGAELNRCSQDHPSKCLFSLLWEKADTQGIHPTASVWATDGRYTLPHCRLGPICSGMCRLIFRPSTVFLGTRCRFTPYASPIMHVHWKISILHINCRVESGNASMGTDGIDIWSEGAAL